MQERVNTLTNSVALLTDTTEAASAPSPCRCSFVQSPNGRAPAARRPARPSRNRRSDNDQLRAKAKQRRVVGAARRGEALAAIAAREDLAETEVALRLHVGPRSAGRRTETLWLAALVNAAAAGGPT